MAMKKCTECGQKVSTRAKSCPYCGKPHPTQGASNVLAGLVLLVMLCGCCIWFGNSFSAKPPSSPPTGSPPPAAASSKPNHDKIAAWVMAKDFVKKNLKAPGSADFGSVFGDYQDPEMCVTDLGGGKYRCAGWVDAQNSFGAKLRNDFVVEVEFVGGDTWRCTDISITPR